MESNGNRKSDKGIIIGAGIGGLSAAIALRRVGIEVEVWERAPELKPAGTALGVMSNAIAALGLLGIDLGLGKTCGAAVDQLTIANQKGVPFVTSESKWQPGPASVCIHRGDLQGALLDAAKGTPIHLGAAARAFERSGNGVRVRFEDGREAQGDFLIGADGIDSVIRRQLHGPAPTRYGGFVCWLATTTFAHPKITPGWNGHYWGKGKRFGLHDIGGGRAYWWGTQSMSESAARHWSGGKAAISRAFAGWSPEIQEVIASTPDDAIVVVPSQDRPFIERWGDGAVTLLGDAAHPMITSLAQGGSCAIEDAVVLANTLGAPSNGATVSERLRAYEDQRRDRTRWMVETSRKLGWVEQIKHPLLLTVRTALMRYAPPARLFKVFQQACTLPPIDVSATPLRTNEEYGISA